jgi:hypothetical protein
MFQIHQQYNVASQKKETVYFKRKEKWGILNGILVLIYVVLCVILLSALAAMGIYKGGRGGLRRSY